MSGRIWEWVWDRFGAANEVANAFQWDQFDAPDDAAATAAADAAAAAAAQCVHSLRKQSLKGSVSFFHNNAVFCEQ